MAERVDDGDLLALTAFIDGEASPAERARIAKRLATDPAFARLHATLARLKACVGDLADEAPPAALPTPRRRLVAAVMAAAAAILALQLPIGPPPHRRPAIVADSTLVLTGRPALVPDLGAAGLRLTGVSPVTDDDAAVVASYTGPRGCRVVLRIGPDRGLAAADTANRWTWTSNGFAYELTAFGMPPARFALIAGAARVATLDAAGGGPADQLLRQARTGAPPCLT